MSDLITITLVTGTERHQSTEPVEAATEDPHQVWAQVLDYAARVGLDSHSYLAEIALAETGLPIYELRCL